MNENFWTKEKFVAWATWLGQIINGLITLVNNLPADTSHSFVGQVNSGQTKTAIVNIAIAVGLGLLQGFLPRLQKKKNK